MGIKERRDVEKAEMKKLIMNAAIEIIEQEGYEKLSIRKIAAKIEYSPTTIYIYYKDKAEIIRDMSKELYSKVMHDIVAIINENTTLSFIEQTHDILYTFIKGLCSEPEMAKAVMFSGVNVIFANDSTDGKPSNSGIDMFDNFISSGISRKIFKPDIENSSWMIVSALLGFVMTSIANQLYLNDNFDLLVDNFIKILIGGMEHECNYYLFK